MADHRAGRRKGDRARILLVSPSSPFPPDSGGSQRTALLYEALARNATVDLFLLERDGQDERARAVLARDYRLLGHCKPPGPLRRALLNFGGLLSPHLRSASRERRKVAAVVNLVEGVGYDAIVLRYSATACQLLGLRGRLPHVKIYVDTDDFLASLLAGSRPGSSFWRWVARIASAPIAGWIMRRERIALFETDGLWVNEPGPSWLNDPSCPPVRALPNIPFHIPEARVSESRDRGAALFLGVGQFRYPPNAEGFDWFLQHVWPAVRHGARDASLRLVGLPPKEPYLSRWREISGVEVVGRVDSLGAEYASASVAIAPIFRGGGTKIKVLEALAMGLPCVCSRHAAAGLEVLTSLLVADDPAEFARYCLELAADAPRRKRHAAIGRREVKEHYSKAHFFGNVQAMVQRDGQPSTAGAGEPSLVL